jgi:hypothetical protein
MEKLYYEIVDTTRENAHVRIEKERQNEIVHQMKIKNCMENLFAHIIQNFSVDTIKSFAQNGYNKCELFSFEKGESYEDFPLIFLTRGPQNYNGFGLKYFEDFNIFPYIKLLQQYFAPFSVYYNTIYKTGSTKIMISWQN